MSFLELEWWAYLFIVLSFFMACLGLNYVVKKINEAKIDERFIRMLHKASTTQSTQVNGPLIVMETSKGIKQNSSKSAQPSPTGISLVFNQEENKRRKDLEDTYNIIKKSMDSRKLETLSLNTNKSLETIDVLPHNRSERNVNDIPVKMIEPERIDSKERSSHNETEKVLIKKHEFGQAKETELISIKKNEYVVTNSAISAIQSDSNLNKLDSITATGRIVPSETTSHIQSDTSVNDDVTNKKSESTNKPGCMKAEETSSKQRSGCEVIEHVPIKNNDSDRSVNKSSMLEIAQKDPKIIGTIKKCKEDLDTDSLIFLDRILSKIATELKALTVDSQNEKSTTDMTATKETFSNNGSGCSITELSFVRKRDSGGIAAKETSKTLSDSNVAELGPAKTSGSETSSHTGSGNTTELSHVKNKDSGGIAGKETPNTRSDGNVAELRSVKMRQSGGIAAKETSSRIVSDRNVIGSNLTKKISVSGGSAVKETPNTRSDGNVAELSSVKMRQSESIAAKETSSRIVNDRNVTGSSLTKKINVSGGSAVKETSKTQSDGNVAELGPVKMSESETSSHTGSWNTTELRLVKKINTGGIAAKETLNTRSDGKGAELNSVKMRQSESIAAKETSSRIVSGRNVNGSSLPQMISESGGSAVKETSKTQSDDNVAELSPIKKRDSEPIVINETSSHDQSDHTETELDPVKICQSERIVDNQTSLIQSYQNDLGLSGRFVANETHTRSVTEYGPVKMNESMRSSGKATSSQSRSAKEISSIKKSVSIKESTRIEAKETSSDERSESNVTEYIPIDSGRIVTKTSILMISPKDSTVIDVTKNDIESACLIKKAEDNTVSKVADTSKTKNDVPPEKQKALSERIKALLTPPMLNEDVMILKPSSSRKKK